MATAGHPDDSEYSYIDDGYQHLKKPDQEYSNYGYQDLQRPDLDDNTQGYQGLKRLDVDDKTQRYQGLQRPYHKHNQQQTERNMEAMRIVSTAGTSSQATCKRPPWWVWLLVVIGLVIIAGLAAVLGFQFWPHQDIQGSPTPTASSSTLSRVYSPSPEIPTSTTTSQTISKIYSTSMNTPTTSKTASPLTDCQALYNAGYTTSGVYTISPDGVRHMTVYCEQSLDGGGRTVFQRRQTGRVNFQRRWFIYKTGFGDPNVEFWLGNDNIHVLTAGRGQRLKVEMTHHNDTRLLFYADYSVFFIENEDNKYRIHVTGFLGGSPPGDSMGYQNYQPFSTYDVDNDASPKHCALEYKGGWWYNDCHDANLNGLYGDEDFGEGINWNTLTGFYTSLTSVRMMVKKLQ